MDSICLQPLFLRIIYIIGRIINIVKFVVPIVLIIRVVIDMYRHVINPDDSDGLGKIKNKIIASVVVFLTPTIVSLLYSFIEKTIVNYQYSDLTLCREYATPENIKILEDKIKNADLKAYEDKSKQYKDAREQYLASVDLFMKSAKVSQGVGEYANNDNIIKCGTGSQYNTGLMNAVRTAGFKTREGVVAAALYLSSHIDVHIPYFWSGGHTHEYKEVHGNSYIEYNDFGDNFIGVSNKWGCNFQIPTYKDSSDANRKQKNGTIWPFGMDCSGFVNWAIMNGGYYTGNKNDAVVPSTDATVFTKLAGVNVDSVKAENAQGKIKPGDIAFKNGHVGMVVEVNDNSYKVAEEQNTAKGLRVNEYSYGKTFTDIVLMDKFYSEYKSSEPLWSGFK